MLACPSRCPSRCLSFGPPARAGLLAFDRARDGSLSARGVLTAINDEPVASCAGAHTARVDTPVTATWPDSGDILPTTQR